MLCKIVILLTLSVICVSSQCDQRCMQHREYTRVKRGKFYSSPPIRFYKYPPIPMLVEGPFSYTPPPFKSDDVRPYPGSRPYKVSNRPPLPSNDGLADDDITNLVKHLSKQDLDKILEFAQEKGQGYNKYKDVYNTNEYTRPYKRESRIVYKGNVHTKYEEPAPYKDDSKFTNFVTEPSFVKVFAAEEGPRPTRINSRPSFGVPNDADNFPTGQKVESYPSSQDYDTASPDSYPNNENPPTYVKVFSAQEPQRPQEHTAIDPSNQASYQDVPISADRIPPRQMSSNSHGPISFPSSNNAYYTESNEEEKLPPPDNMRQEDFEVSYTNNVPKIVKAESNSYDVENFGDLPLMEYHSKLHDVSSYHVPHYTVTQPKQSKPAAPSSVSFPSSYSSSTSALLKISPAAAAVKQPVYERAPSVAAAAEQSDAHLKAVKIWSHKSQGAAYTLHDDGSLTPERSRPKYG